MTLTCVLQCFLFFLHQMVLVRNIRLLHFTIHLLRNAAKGTSTESKGTTAKIMKTNTFCVRPEAHLKASRPSLDFGVPARFARRPARVPQGSPQGWFPRENRSKCLRKDSPQGPRKAQKMTRRAPQGYQRVTPQGFLVGNSYGTI